MAPTTTPRIEPRPPTTTIDNTKDRERELEHAGVDEGEVRGEEGPGHPAERGAGGIGEELRPRDRDPGARGGALVVAEGDPGPADARVAQPQVDDEHEDD